MTITVVTIALCLGAVIARLLDDIHEQLKRTADFLEVISWKLDRLPERGKSWEPETRP